MAKVAKKKAKKTVAKKLAVTKAVAKKAVARKPAKKAVARKPAKKAVARKPAKKAVARKPAKKAVAKAKVTKALAQKPVKKAVVTGRREKRASTANGRASHGASRKNGRRDGASAFLPDPSVTGHRRVRDDLAEELGEEFVSAVTSGEAVDDARDEPVPEEDGGPFVTTTATSQYGQGTDASNPEDAEREAFPTTRSERR